MRTNDIVAFYACVICSAVWTSSSSDIGTVLGLVWLLGAIAILLLSKE